MRGKDNNGNYELQITNGACPRMSKSGESTAGQQVTSNK